MAWFGKPPVRSLVNAEASFGGDMETRGPRKTKGAPGKLQRFLSLYASGPDGNLEKERRLRNSPRRGKTDFVC